MKLSLFILLTLFISSVSNAQLFAKLDRKKKTEVVKPDSIYLKIIKILTTVEDSVFHYQDTVTKIRYEIPECLKCIDTRGKKLNDVVVIPASKFEEMIIESQKPKRRTKRSLIEN